MVVQAECYPRSWVCANCQVVIILGFWRDFFRDSNQKPHHGGTEPRRKKIADAEYNENLHKVTIVKSLLRDIVLSYAPAELRRLFPPASTERLRIIALAGGLLQFLIALVWLLVRAQKFMALQYARWSPVLPLDENLLLGAPSFIFFLSYLLYPTSLVLVYFIGEGMV